MKKAIFFIIFLFLLIMLLITDHLFAATRGISIISKHGDILNLYKDYHALVIGITNYERWPRLPNAINDAKEVASKLKDLGFDVKLVLDPTSREIKTLLSEMVYKMGIEENRAILFYYAGHGETETLADKSSMGYIIPRDCPLLEKDPMSFATHAISMRDIESASLRIRSKHVLMLFDSCFSGSLFALVRAVPADITEKSTLPVRQYITAGREDEQVPDKSMFKRCFLIGLDGDADLTGGGYITGSELGMYLSDKVINYTHRRQHPQYGKINNPDLDRGDFIFIPSKVKKKEVMGEKRRQEESSAIVEELKRLQEERKKSEELVEQMKSLLEAKVQFEKNKQKALAENMELAQKVKQTEEDRDANRSEMDAKIKNLKSLLMASEENLRKESDEKMILEKEMKKMSTGSKKDSLTHKELQKEQGQERLLASIPKEVSDAKIYHKVKLRSSPEELWRNDTENMLRKYNFFENELNEYGDFLNNFVDNGDGTVTDKVTDLMWEKGGSSSALYYWKVKRYISRLNKKRYVGYDDWRIPTLEELCSLLERISNQKNLHISPLFYDNQSKCWSTDRFGENPYPNEALINRIVNFTNGEIDKAVIEGGGYSGYSPEQHFVKAVRTIK